MRLNITIKEQPCSEMTFLATDVPVSGSDKHLSRKDSPTTDTVGRGSRKVAKSNAVQTFSLGRSGLVGAGPNNSPIRTTTETQDGCLEVPPKTSKRVTWKGKRLYAYQLLCGASQGVPPRQDEVVRHRCHNRRCNNPEHLQLVTQQDNTHDDITRQYRWPGLR